nr:histo-blood group ABO system transferase 2-like [Pipistrellus kuhlii]
MAELRRDLGPTTRVRGGKGSGPFLPGPSHRGKRHPEAEPSPPPPGGAVREEPGPRVLGGGAAWPSAATLPASLSHGVSHSCRPLCFRILYPQPRVLTPSRNDVLVLTPWLAPVIWEGTFNIALLNEQFRLQNLTVGLTVFAIKKYVAYIPWDQGDFYYLGGLFGGSVSEVHRLTTACHQAMSADRANGIEAVWQDESHLNRYLLDHKPTKVLSPEYLWDEQLLGRPAVLRKLRFVAVPKDHQQIRN